MGIALPVMIKQIFIKVQIWFCVFCLAESSQPLLSFEKVQIYNNFWEMAAKVKGSDRWETIARCP